MKGSTPFITSPSRRVDVPVVGAADGEHGGFGHALPLSLWTGPRRRRSMDRDWDAEGALVEAHAGAGRIALISGSYQQLTGRQLVNGGTLWDLPAVVVAHSTEDDPIFFYGNRAALTLFDFPLPNSSACPRASRPRRSTARSVRGCSPQ